MTAKPQPMAGQSEAPDDLIAELARLMAQDAQSTPPPKPVVNSPFTVRIPGEPANIAPPQRSEPVRIPQAIPVEPRPAPSTSQAPSAAAAGQADTAPNPFSFVPDRSPRREPAAPAPAAPQPELVDLPEHDSIADLIAAELAMDSQPAAVAAAVAQPPAPVPPPRPATAAPTSDRAAPGPTAEDRRPQPQVKPVDPAPAVTGQSATSEPDTFKVAPVFGLGNALAQAKPVTTVRATPVSAEPVFAKAPVPAAPAPAPLSPRRDDTGSDSIGEIESLIGRAVRVELDTRAAPSPLPDRQALRSLATPSLPKAAVPAPRGISGADEAIMAAALAYGAEIGWVEAPEIEQAEPLPTRQRRIRSWPKVNFGRAIAGPLVAMTLLLAAGFGLYWVLGMGGDAGPAPLLTADASPTKQVPVAAAEPAAEPQSAVFDEINGVVPGAEEQLVSRDQADVNEVTQVATAPEISSEGLANRKVRTVTVRPDGTIVSSENSVAGSTILPVARPNVPVIAGAAEPLPELLANATPQEPAAATPATARTPAPATADPAAALPALPADTGAPADAAVAALPPTEPATPAAPPAQIVTPGATVPAVDAAGNPLTGRTAVIPLQRPSSFARQPTPAPAAAPAPVEAVVAPLVPTTTPLQGQPSAAIPGATEVAALANDAPAYVQLASQRTEAEARATAQGLVTRFGPVFGGANMEVQRVNLGSRGVFYRVRVPASSTEQADNICLNVKAAGGDCFTM